MHRAKCEAPGRTMANGPALALHSDNAPLWCSPTGRSLHESRFGAKPCLAGTGRTRGHRRSAPGQRPAQLHAGRPGRGRSEGGTRARALGAAQRRAGVPVEQENHRQPRPCRPAQGLGPLRSADRTRHPCGQRADRCGPARGLGVRGRAVVVRAVAPRARCAGHGPGAAPPAGRRPPGAATAKRAGGRAGAWHSHLRRRAPAGRGAPVPAPGQHAARRW